MNISQEEGRDVGANFQHVEDVKQTKKKWLSCLLGEFEEEKGIADPGARMPEAVKKRGVDTSLQNLILFTSMLEKYVTAGGKSNSGLFSKNEIADDEQKKSVAEGQEGEAATPMVAADATWRMTPAEVVNMLIACEVGSSSRGQDSFQPEDKLDMEIEYIRRLMMRVTQEQQTAT